MQQFADEWKILQQQQYIFEIGSLVIKLCNVFLLLLLIIFNITLVIGTSVLLVLWLQDAIFKTFQARGETRLLILERSIEKNIEKCEEMGAAQSDLAQADSVEAEKPFQLNQQFMKNRPTTLGLIQSYLQQS